MLNLVQLLCVSLYYNILLFLYFNSHYFHTYNTVLYLYRVLLTFSIVSSMMVQRYRTLLFCVDFYFLFLFCHSFLSFQLKSIFWKNVWRHFRAVKKSCLFFYWIIIVLQLMIKNDFDLLKIILNHVCTSTKESLFCSWWLKTISICYNSYLIMSALLLNNYCFAADD